MAYDYEIVKLSEVPIATRERNGIWTEAAQNLKEDEAVKLTGLTKEKALKVQNRISSSLRHGRHKIRVHTRRVQENQNTWAVYFWKRQLLKEER